MCHLCANSVCVCVLRANNLTLAEQCTFWPESTLSVASHLPPAKCCSSIALSFSHFTTTNTFTYTGAIYQFKLLQSETRGRHLYLFHSSHLTDLTPICPPLSCYSSPYPSIALHFYSAFVFTFPAFV